MKKNTVLSVVTIFLCFLIGYAAFQTAELIRSLVTETMSDCKSNRNSGCNNNPEMPAVDPRKR